MPASKKPTEASVRKQAEARDLQLVKVGKKYRLEAPNGTVVADDWETGGGLMLGQVAKALDSS